MGVICVVIWILLFGAGLMIPSESYRKSLEQSFTLYNFFMAGLLYTYTNVVTLTCFAGLLGGICSRITFRDYEDATSEGNNQSAKPVSVSMAYRKRIRWRACSGVLWFFLSISQGLR